MIITARKIQGPYGCTFGEEVVIVFQLIMIMKIFIMKEIISNLDKNNASS